MIGRWSSDRGNLSSGHAKSVRVSWIALRITPDANRDGVIAALFKSGSQGVQEDGACVVTHFPADARIDDIRAAVIRADPLAGIAVADSPDADYSQWRASVSARISILRRR